MKIIRLTAENIKRLTAVEITPEGHLVEISGNNGNGKTSVLDSIWMALGGEKTIPDKPVRDGADKGRIELRLGTAGTVDYIVERRFTAKGGTTLTVKNPEGVEQRSPQMLLSSLLGALTFDPMDFMRGDDETQFESLRRLAKVEFDFEAADKANETDFARRTDVNRKAKEKRIEADAIKVPTDLPDRAIDEKDILDAMTTAGQTNAGIETRRANRQRVADDAERWTSEALTKRDQAKALIEGAEALEAQAAEAYAKLGSAPPLPDPIDVTGLRAELDQAVATNKLIADRDRRYVIIEEGLAAERESEALTAAMEERDKAKAAALADAEMPIPGLSFGDGAVLYNRLPLGQASDAEQLIVSTSIAAALNPKLRVIRIRDGSLLDDNSLALLGKFAKERDFQIWIEMVHGAGPTAIVMEDGHVAG